MIRIRYTPWDIEAVVLHGVIGWHRDAATAELERRRRLS